MNKLIILSIILLLVSSVMSLDFDNVKSYDSSKKEITIKNSFGLGKEIAKIKLIYNTANCGGNKECYAIMELKIKENTINPLSKISFKDMKKSSKNLDYNVYIKKDKYILYSDKEELNGTYLIKLNATKQLDEIIDWIPTFYGLDITEWAIWGSLQTYDDFDDGSINTTLWTSSGTATPNEGAGLMSIDSGVNENGAIVSDIFPLWNTLENITIWSRGLVDGDASSYARLSVFGNTILNAVGAGGTPDISGVYDIYRNGSNFDVYKDTVFQEQITPSSSVIQISSKATNTAGYDAHAYLDYVYFTSTNETMNITLNYPVNYNKVNGLINVSFNISSNVSENNLKNMTLYIDDSLTERKDISGKFNSTIFSREINVGNHNWSAYVCDDSDNCKFSSTEFFEVVPFSVIYTYNSSTYETSYETFEVNITYNTTYSITARLNYNNTYYTTTKTGTGSNVLFTKSLDIPLVTTQSNIPFFWNFTMINGSGTYYFSTNETNQTVDNIRLVLCNSTSNVSYINFTFQDESDFTAINASIPYSTFDYYLGSGNIYNTLTFINNTENLDYSFCFEPTDKNVSVDYYIQYEKTGYPQRISDLGVLGFSNITTNTTLYLLATADGLYVTFQVLNSADQPINDVSVTAVRTLDDTTAGSGTTGADGGVTFWINPNYQYNLTFNKTGYDLYSILITPTQSSYTVVLGQTTTTNITDYNRGISYSVLPVGYLVNDTTYSFNFTISSTYWNLDSYGINLTNSSNIIFATDSDTTSTGGTVNVDVDTGSNKTFILEFYYIANGTLITMTKSYTIIDDSYSSWSIKNLLDDFGTYVSSGLFGLTVNGVGILAFLIIFTISGFLTYKFGLISPAAIMGFIFGLVLLFDVGLGLLTVPSDIGAVAHFPSILTAIIFIGIFFREVSR